MELLFTVRYSKWLKLFYGICIILYLGFLIFVTEYLLNREFNIILTCELILLYVVLIVVLAVAMHFFRLHIEVYDSGIKAVYRKSRSSYKRWEEIEEVRHTNTLILALTGFTTIKCYDGIKIRVKPDMENYKRLMKMLMDKT